MRDFELKPFQSSLDIDPNRDLSYRLYFDGSSFGKGRRGGPGPSAGAALIVAPNGEHSYSSSFIRRGDSDLAEYTGILCGLYAARAMGVKNLQIYGDSRNIIDQVLGLKQLLKPELLQLRDQSLQLLNSFASWELQWIPRLKNHLADAEARRCITLHLESAHSQTGTFRERVLPVDKL